MEMSLFPQRIFTFQLPSLSKKCNLSHTVKQVCKAACKESSLLDGARYSRFPHLGDICQRLLILHQHLGKLLSLVRADPHDVPQQEDPVRGVAHLEECE